MRFQKYKEFVKDLRESKGLTKRKLARYIHCRYPEGKQTELRSFVNDIEEGIGKYFAQMVGGRDKLRRIQFLLYFDALHLSPRESLRLKRSIKVEIPGFDFSLLNYTPLISVEKPKRDIPSEKRFRKAQKREPIIRDIILDNANEFSREFPNESSAFEALVSCGEELYLSGRTIKKYGFEKFNQALNYNFDVLTNVALSTKTPIRTLKIIKNNLWRGLRRRKLNGLENRGFPRVEYIAEKFQESLGFQGVRWAKGYQGAYPESLRRIVLSNNGQLIVPAQIGHRREKLARIIRSPGQQIKLAQIGFEGFLESEDYEVPEHRL